MWAALIFPSIARPQETCSELNFQLALGHTTHTQTGATVCLCVLHTIRVGALSVRGFEWSVLNPLFWQFLPKTQKEFLSLSLSLSECREWGK